MKLFSFKGGVHPFEGKELAKGSPITELKPTGQLAFALSQHIGAPAKAIVKAGDRVLRGQMIAEAGGFVSAPVHSSVSGTVKGIKPHMTATGSPVSCILVENDGLYEEAERLPVIPLAQMTKDDILNRVGEAGIVGMGGAGFPTKVKLMPKDPLKIDTIIANCCECEPYITADYRVMMETPERLIKGMRVILKLFPMARGVFAVENNKMDCVEKLRALCANETDMEVAVMKTKYPQGCERQIINAITGRAINSSCLPADAGCIVDNVGTLCAISDAVFEGKPLYERVLTVSGEGIQNPSNFLVPVGMNVSEIIEAAGGFRSGAEKVVSGGPMMGFSMITTDVPVTKTSSSILVIEKDEVSRSETTACINCGRCVDACPEFLVPSRLADAAERNDLEVFDKDHGAECIECGSCSYVCPAKRHLKQSIATAKKMVLAERKKKAAAMK